MAFFLLNTKQIHILFIFCVYLFNVHYTAASPILWFISYYNRQHNVG